MDRVTPRMLAAWLIVALALSVAFVGCATITSQDAPTNRLTDLEGPMSMLNTCTMSNGESGLAFDDLCLPAPPAGWTGTPVVSVEPASFLAMPDRRECRSSILTSNAVAA